MNENLYVFEKKKLLLKIIKYKPVLYLNLKHTTTSKLYKQSKTFKSYTRQELKIQLK